MSGVTKAQKGGVIARQGDATPQMYIILQGSAGVYKNYGAPDETRMSTLGRGDYFGENSLFLGKGQTSSVVADGDVILLHISRENAHEFFINQPETAFALMRALCSRADGRRDLYQKLFAPPTAAAAPAPAAPETAAPKQAANPALEAAPATASAAQPSVPSGPSPLFPEGHGSYTLPLDNGNREFLQPKDITCPMCGKSFQNLNVRSVKLRAEKTDYDLRVHYVGFEPLLYDVTSCPHCLYSAMAPSFAKGIKNRALGDILAPYKDATTLKTGLDKDSQSVFAGYYLALLCAPLCFKNHELVSANLWLRLSRVYDDCEDAAMWRFAAEKAREGFLHAYEWSDIPEDQLQKLYMMIGELSYRLGDVKEARNYFFKAKTDKLGSKTVGQMAEDRINEIRDAQA